MERRAPFVLAWILFLLGTSVGQDDVSRTKGHVAPAAIQNPTRSSVAPTKNRPSASSAQKTQALTNYSRLPLSFEPNQGQAGSPVKYLARGGQFNVFLTQDEVAFGFARRQARRRSVLDIEDSAALEPPELSSLELRLVGASSSSPVLGEEQLGGTANYLVGRDPSQWHVNLPTFAKVRYRNVYRGVDLLYYGNQGEIESDFIIAPGANPEAVKLSVVGAEAITIAPSGDLVLRMKDGELRLRKPLVYQMVGASRREIAGGYVLASNNQVSFRVARYDHKQPLIIDPVLSYSTYLGGNGVDEATAIAVDSAGNAYITGDTTSTNFPTTLGPATGDMFVAKLSPTGTKLYATYVGGTAQLDFPTGIGVDALSNAYVVGQTGETNLPTTPGALRTTYQGGAFDGFVFSLNSAGAGFNYFTYLGGSAFDLLSAVAVDSLGNAYITGQTDSGDYPILNPFETLATAGDGGIFTTTNSGTNWTAPATGLVNRNITVVAVDPKTPTTLYAATSESGVIKSTNSGAAWNAINTGLTSLVIQALVVDPVTPANVYVGTGSGGVFVSNNGGTSWATMNAGLVGINVHALAIDPSSPGTLYASTGGNGVFKFASGAWSATGALPQDIATAIVVDPTNNQNVYASFQNSGVYRSSNGGTSWAAFNTGLSSLQVAALAIDHGGHLYAGTRTGGVFLSTSGGSWTTINTGLPFSVFQALATDPTNNTTVYVGTFNGGVFRSTNNGTSWSEPASNGLNTTRVSALAVDPTTPTNLYAGSQMVEAVVTKLSPSGGLVFSSYLGGGGGESGFGIAIDGDNGNLYVAGFTNSLNFPTVAPAQATMNGGISGFVSKVKSDGSGLTYSTYLGGSGNSDQAFAIAADSAGNAYVTGLTNSADFPTLNPTQSALSGSTDAFLAKYNASGQKLFATYLGGEGTESGNAITATANTDGSTSAWVAGQTTSIFFPLANPIQIERGNQNSTSNAGFISDFNFPASGAAPTLVFSTYLGTGCGTGCDTIAQAIGHDGTNNIYVAGRTMSNSFPAVNAAQPTLAGPQNAFIAKIGATTSNADLSLTLNSFGPTTVVAGAAVNFSMTVTNNGPNDAPNVSLGGRGGANLNLVTCTVTQGICGNNLQVLDRGFAELGTLASGTSATITGTLLPLSPCGVAGAPVCPYVIDVDARSDANDPNPSNNSATTNLTVLPGADLAVTLSASPSPAPVQVGGTLNYIANVANLGPSNASNVTAVFTLVPTTAATFVSLPTGCTNSAPGTLTCVLGPMPAGTAGLDTIPVTVNSLPITAEIVVSNTPEADPDPSNNSASMTTTLSASSVNNAELNGQYAFVLRGFDPSGNAIAIGGSFTADGAGNIAGGVKDVNIQNSSVAADLSITAANSSYSVGADHRGILTLTTSAGTETFDFSVGSISSGVASLGHIISRRSASATNGSAISGVFKKQDPTAFTLAALNGDWAFLNEGVDVSGGRFANAGRFTLSGGNLTLGSEDFNDNGVFDNGTTTASTFTGSFGSLDTTNGRAPVTTTVLGGGSTDEAVYIVSASEVLFMSIDAISANPLAGGSALRQATTFCPTTGNCNFTNSALSGNAVVYLQGNSSSVAGASDVSVGVVTFTPATTSFSAGFDENDGGVIYCPTGNICANPGGNGGSGNYSVASNGRVTLTQTGKGNAPFFYMVDTNRAFLVGAGSGVDAGVAENQAGPIAASSLGSAFGTEPPAVSSSLMFSGVQTVTAIGSTTASLTGTTDDVNSVGPIPDITRGGLHEDVSLEDDTLTLDPTTGRFTFASGTKVGYFINSNKRVAIDIETTNTAPYVIISDNQSSQAAPTVSFTGAPASAPYGSTFNVTATTNASTTAVITASGACSITGNTVTMTSGTGTCSLTASWAADANYTAASLSQSTTATQIAPTVSFTGAPASAAYGATFNVTAATNASTTAVITASGACSVAGTTVTMTSGTGTCSLTASWAADANYTAASLSQSTTATPAALTITASSGTMTYGGTVPTITASYSGFVNGDTASSLTTPPTCTTTATSTSPAGTYPSSCSGAVDANYTITYVNGAVTVSTAAAPPTVTSTVPVGSGPGSAAVNPVTNKVYVTNANSNNVTVIDGATNTTTTVTDPNAMIPVGVSVNTVTNKIYVSNAGSGNVTVIDGATNTTTTVTTGANPDSMAVNPITNMIYVANQVAGTVTVINGATSATTTLAAGTNPLSVALNPVTNKIYVTNNHSANVTVIDGATNTVTATVATGTSPTSIAVNAATNKIYVPNYFSNSVSVIDGTTNTVTATVPVGTNPVCVALNPVTNQIYVANTNSANVTVIDGATNNTTTVPVGTLPQTVVVNTVTNTIFVTNQTSNNVTVIAGATNNTTTLAVGTAPNGLAVNPVTNKIYVANSGSNNVTVLDGAANTTSTVSAGTAPSTVGVNPVTNNIYVANLNSANVTVIDGTTNTTSTVTAVESPYAVAVNPVTNQIYVAAANGAAVTVIDGATNTTSTITAGPTLFPNQNFETPYTVAVNPATNQIYLANEGSNTVTVIDGATNTTSTVPTGSTPWAVVVNPVTNKIYVANEGGNTVTVIDGATNTTSTVTVGANPYALAVNPVTNKIYVANDNNNVPGGGTVTVIDGATNTTTTLAAGTQPIDVAVNPVTNQIYVLNVGTLTVIDGASNSTSTVPTMNGLPGAVAVNPVTNKIYVTNYYGTGTVTVIDGATDTTSTVTAGSGANGAAVNPVTNQIYVANEISNNVTVITEQQVQPIPLTTSITPLAGNSTTSPTPIFSFTASSTFAPTAPPVDALYFQLDTWQGPWTPATSTGDGGFGGTAPTLSLGTHILYAYATDGQDASSIMTTVFGGSSPVIGAISAYPFVVNTSAPGPATHFAVSAPTTATAGTAFNFTVTAQDASGNTATTYGGTVHFTSSDPAATLPANSTLTNGVGTFSATLKTAGSQTITATDTVTASITGTSNTITVSAGAASHFAVSAPGTATAGTPFNFTVTAQDQFNNTATGYTGTVHFTSSDSTATLPANSTLTNGVGTFSATLKTAGSQTITATDTVTASITGSSTITVSNPAPTITTVSPTSATAGGGAFTLTVNGAGFVSGSTVNFNGNARATTFVSATQLTAAILASDIATAGNVNVTVTNPAGGGTSAPAVFVVSAANPVPAITSISPTSAVAGAAGFTLTVNGTGFVSTSTVNFGASAPVTTFVSPTQLTAAIPATAIATAGNVNVTVVSPGPGGGTSNIVTFTVGTVAATADLAVTMTALPSPVPVLGSVTYQITVTNNGPNPATGVVLTDTLPAGTVFASISDLTDCVVSNGTLTCRYSALGVGSAQTVNLILVPLAVPSGAGTFDNTVSVTANETDPNLSNNSATQTVQVTGTTLPGGGAFRNLSGFSNNILPGNDDGSVGPVPLSPVPGNLNLNFFGVQVSSVFINNNGNVTFGSPLGTFTPFPLTTTNVQIIAPYFSDVETDFPTSGLVTYGNDTVNGRPAFGVNWPNVEYFGEGPATLLDLFQVILVDRSDVGAGNFDIEFNYNKIQWETGDASGGTLGLGGSSARVGYSNGSQTAGSFFELPGSGVPGSFLDTNTTTGLIYNDLNSTQPGRYLFQVRGGTVQSSADMAISANGPPSAATGSTITYTLTATNLGPNTATGVTVTDTLPAGFTFVSVAPSNICSPAGQPVVVTCNVGSLANGSNAIITIQASIPTTASGTATDTAVVSVPNNQDLNLGNNTATVLTNITVLNPDLTIIKTHNDPFAQGQTGATYTITVTNSGTGATTGTVTVNDALPTGLTATAISGAGDSNWACTLQPLSCTRSDVLAAGASYDPITLTVTVVANATLGQVTNTATVSGGGEVNTANDTASDVTNIVAAAAALVPTVAVIPPPDATGTTISYTVTITNNGPSAATSVTLTDQLTGNAGFVSATSATMTCPTTPSATSLNCTLAVLNNGASVTVTITVNLTGAGWDLNAIGVTSPVPNPNPAAHTLTVQRLSVGGNTVTGSDVAVQPMDSASGASPAVLTFADVTRGGTTTLASAASGPAPPAGFRTGTPAVFYNLATTAGYAGTIGVALSFNAASFHHAAKVRLFHSENGAWVDRTVAINPAGAYAVARVTSLSPFALFEPINHVPEAKAGLGLSTVATSAQGAKVTLNGSASFDADQDPLTYRWTGPFPEGNGVATGVSPTVTMPPGGSTVTLVVNDGEADSAPATQNIIVTDFSMAAAASGPTTISAGGSVGFSVTASPQFGPFPPAIALACLGLPQGAQCNFSTTSVNAGGPAATLTISTTPRTAAALAPVRHRNPAPLYTLWMPLPAIALMGLGLRRRSRKRAAALMLLLLLGMMLLLVSCGGGSMGTTPPLQNGTPAGTFTVTVLGTANGSLQHTTLVTFTVQ